MGEAGPELRKSQDRRILKYQGQGIRGNFKRIVISPDEWDDAYRALSDMAGESGPSNDRSLIQMMRDLRRPKLDALISGQLRIESYFTQEGWNEFGQAIFDRAKQIGLNPIVIETDVIDNVAAFDRY